MVFVSERFERVIGFVYSKRGLKIFLALLSHLAVAVSFVAYCGLVLFYFRASLSECAVLLTTSALPFLAVSILRRFIDAPRPYELTSVFSDPPKKTAGRSFPSRHTYSGFFVAVPVIFVNFAAGWVLLTLAFCMSVARVLLGYHFPRDIVAGGVMGAVAGVGTALALTLV